jgi:hypothetical protein
VSIIIESLQKNDATAAAFMESSDNGKLKIEILICDRPPNIKDSHELLMENL